MTEEPVVFRTGRLGPALLVAPAALGFGLAIQWLGRSGSTSLGVVALGYSLIALGMGAWFLMNSYTITIDQKAVTISTALWRRRGLPPLRFERSRGISVSCSQVFWHRSVTINGAHIEIPFRSSFFALMDALDDPQISVEEPDEGLKDGIGMSALVGILVVGFASRGLALFVASTILLGGLLAVMFLHSYRVDGQWQSVLDDLASTIPTDDA